MQNQDGIWLHFSSQTYSFGSAEIMNLYQILSVRILWSISNVCQEHCLGRFSTCATYIQIMGPQVCCFKAFSCWIPWDFIQPKVLSMMYGNG